MFNGDEISYLKQRVSDLEILIKADSRTNIPGLNENFNNQIQSINKYLFGQPKKDIISYLTGKTEHHPAILGLKDEIEKLKAIVAELADTVHKDNDK